MTIATEQSSDQTGLSIAEEVTFKTLAGDSTDIWRPVSVNEYGDFGANLTVTPREPITADRQRQKGVITDLDAPASFTEDLTYVSSQRFMRGAMFANYREKALFGSRSTSGIVISGITAIDDTFTVASGGASVDADDIVFGEGFAQAANNGLHIATSSTATTVVVATALTDETPAVTATLTRVGHEFAAGDLSITNAGGAFPTLTSAGGKDLTELDINVGEWIFIGGDVTINKFTTAANNTRCRVRSVTATVITFDKTDGDLVTESGGVLEIHLYLGRVIKNESTQALIVKRFFQLERRLGVPDDANPADEQAEYVIGGSLDEWVLNWPTSEIITTEYKFMGADHGTNAATSPGLKAGTRPSLVAADAFNSSNHARRINLQQISTTSANPGALFTWVKEMTLTLKNNIKLNKAITVLGGFSTNPGGFHVSVEMTVFFATVAGLAAKRANADITLDAHLYDQNKGIAIDVPLLAMADGLPEIEKNEAIMLTLTNEAASGSQIDAGLNHTLMICYFDYLPTLAGG